MHKTLHHKLLLSLLTAAVATLGLAGCKDDASPRDNTPPTQTTPATTPIDDPNPMNPDPEPDDDGQDPDQEVTPLGAFHGAWHVAMTDVDQTPMVLLDINHEKDATEADGRYTAYSGLVGDDYSGQTGELMGVAINGDTVTVTFNPSPNAEEVVTLTGNRAGEGSYTGTIFFESDGSTQPVAITYVTPPN